MSSYLFSSHNNSASGISARRKIGFVLKTLKKTIHDIGLGFCCHIHLHWHASWQSPITCTTLACDLSCGFFSRFFSPRRPYCAVILLRNTNWTHFLPVACVLVQRVHTFCHSFAHILAFFCLLFVVLFYRIRKFETTTGLCFQLCNFTDFCALLTHEYLDINFSHFVQLVPCFVFISLRLNSKRTKFSLICAKFEYHHLLFFKNIIWQLNWKKIIESYSFCWAVSIY